MLGKCSKEQGKEESRQEQWEYTAKRKVAKEKENAYSELFVRLDAKRRKKEGLLSVGYRETEVEKR